jgi:hypothetical protein
MSVRLDGHIIKLEGACRVEDAEPLLAWLQADRSRVVDLTGAEHLHAAVVQVLIAVRPALEGESRDLFIRNWLAPLIGGAGPIDTGLQEG